MWHLHYVWNVYWWIISTLTICSTLTGLWYGQEEVGYPALLILLELHNKLLCSKHSSESDFTTTERVHLNRFTVPCNSDSCVQSLPQPPDTPSFDPLVSILTPEEDLHVLTPTKTYSKTPGTLHNKTYSCPCRQSFNFLSNVCNPTITSSSQHLCNERNLISPKLSKYEYFWCGTRAYQSLQQVSTL
jgi:hypothetical protein